MGVCIRYAGHACPRRCGTVAVYATALVHLCVAAHVAATRRCRVSLPHAAADAAAARRCHRSVVSRVALPLSRAVAEFEKVLLEVRARTAETTRHCL